MYMYMYMCIYINVLIYIQLYVCMYICVLCIYVHINVFMYICIYVCMYMCVCVKTMVVIACRYFNALANNEVLPVKERLELPLPSMDERLGGITKGGLAVLHKQVCAVLSLLLGVRIRVMPRAKYWKNSMNNHVILKGVDVEVIKVIQLASEVYN